jgi:BirA family biotin operon repressor/biotin-[acetyl-CoA-carboxylase] ligase
MMQKNSKNKNDRHAALDALAETFEGLQIQCFDEIDSTNAEAKRMACGGFEDARALITARTQSMGRGRMGRSFYSPADTGAYFSVLCRVSGELIDAVTVTSAASVAVMRAIRTLTGLQAEIKWVNDLYLNGKKICGILVEGTGLENSRFMIIGIGVNISTENFPPELREIAGAVGAHTLDAQTLIAEIYRELAPYLDDPSNRSWLADYRTYSCVIGKRVRWMQNGVWREGAAAEIDADGALQVETDEGEKIRLYSGEITLRTAEI